MRFGKSRLRHLFQVFQVSSKTKPEANKPNVRYTASKNARNAQGEMR